MQTLKCEPRDIKLYGRRHRKHCRYCGKKILKQGQECPRGPQILAARLAAKISPAITRLQQLEVT